MIAQIFTGFDSAWTDSAKQPGAIANIVHHADGRREWVEPVLATFREAEREMLRLARQTPLHLIAIDQPTIVPNWSGSRPVDKVAGALISRIKGGVQPANRGKAPMFGDDAAIWRLLDSIPHVQAPWDVLPVAPMTSSFMRNAYVIMEVFPALALPALIPSFLQRGIGAKYNPANKAKFNLDDWVQVCVGIGAYAADYQIPGLERWARKMAMISVPTKSDQDRIDAALCAVIAHHWRHGPEEANIVIGDVGNGYIVSIVTPEIRKVLEDAAHSRSVPCNQRWERGLPVRGAPLRGPHRRTFPPSKLSGQEEPKRASRDLAKIKQTGRAPRASVSLAAADDDYKELDRDSLRAFLVSKGRQGATVTYGETLAVFGKPCHQGSVGQLTRILDAIAIENQKRDEPILAALVVNKREGLPGAGFYKHANLCPDATAADKRTLLVKEVARIKFFDWPDADCDDQ